MTCGHCKVVHPLDDRIEELKQQLYGITTNPCFYYNLDMYKDAANVHKMYKLLIKERQQSIEAESFGIHEVSMQMPMVFSYGLDYVIDHGGNHDDWRDL